MWKQFNGRRSVPQENWVERGAVRRFAEAIGDRNPLYVDEEVAGRSRYGGLIAPPTFPVTFDYGTIEDIALPASGLILGGQALTSSRPLRVGERVLCHLALEDEFEKVSSSGTLLFLILDRKTESAGGIPICSLRTTVIVTEAVRRRLSR